jgi:hypothetical protein
MKKNKKDQKQSGKDRDSKNASGKNTRPSSTTRESPGRNREERKLDIGDDPAETEKKIPRMDPQA